MTSLRRWKNNTNPKPTKKWVAQLWWYYNSRDDFKSDATDEFKKSFASDVLMMYYLGLTAEQAGQVLRSYLPNKSIYYRFHKGLV